MRSFKKTYQIGAGETDCFGRCRLSAFLNYMQDAATTHANEIGFSRDVLVEKFGSIWILARCWFEISEPLIAFKNLEIETWHRGISGVMLYRDFSISQDGAHIGHATNAWVLADVNTHRAKRPVGMEELESKSANPERSLGITLSKLAPENELSNISERIIRYSDLDVNCHLNNAKYGDLICDAISMDTLNPCYFSSLQINYLGECKPGEKITLKSDVPPSFVAGFGEDGSDKFSAKFQLDFS